MKSLRIKIKDPQDMSLEELIETQFLEIPLYSDNGWLYLDPEDPSFIDKLYYRGLKDEQNI